MNGTGGKVDKRAFVAFSGGGAKGVVHVGALKALEGRDVRLLGLSGTSAGAIVASLAAAGFGADDLINERTGRTILSELSKIDPRLRRAVDLFGRGGWWRVRLFRLAAQRPLLRWFAFAAAWALPPLIAVLIFRLRPSDVALWCLIAWTALGAGLWLAYRSVIGGLADVRRFRDAMAELLRRKMFSDEPGRVVRMRDFGVGDRPGLKIVSANLSRRSLHLFSAERTPDTPVADAVAASICLPVIFRPWSIDGELHVDGGIVSNLPAWPFDEERELDPEALTIAVEIEDKTNHRRLDRANWPSAAIRTTLFGSGELNLRIAGPAERLALPTSLNLLDFDRTVAEVAKEVRDVASAAGLRLDKRLFRLPEIYRDACRVAQALTLDGLGLTAGGHGSQPRVRVAVGRLERGYTRSLRLSHSVGFDQDTDESMLVPLVGSVAGVAWQERQSRVEALPLAPDRDLPGPANRLRRKSRWPGLAWVMCIPILDEKTGEPILLVQSDGNSALPSNASTAAALQGVEEAIKDFFSLVLHELRDIEDDHGTEEHHVDRSDDQSLGNRIQGAAPQPTSASDRKGHQGREGLQGGP